MWKRQFFSLRPQTSFLIVARDIQLKLSEEKEKKKGTMIGGEATSACFSQWMMMKTQWWIRVVDDEVTVRRTRTKTSLSRLDNYEKRQLANEINWAESNAFTLKLLQS